MKRIPYLLALGILFAGCTPKTDTAKGGEAQPGETPKTVGIPPSEPGKSGLDTSPTDTPLVGQLPAELKHDGFEYYGLANEQPIEIEVTSAPNGRTLTGTQTTKLVSFAGGKATFRRERTGNLESLGIDEYSLEPTGIYVTSSTVAKTKDRYLEIPAKLDAGKTWQDTTEIEMNGQSLKMNNVYKVVGQQKVKTKKGELDALLITSTGKGVVEGKNVRMDSKSWYVKGMGNVKTEIKMTPSGGEAQTITYQIVG